jgi:signal transduction histidine kinase/ActR/RegA family two-component response regulator
MRLRTKFLLSLVVVTASLTCATLLVVRQTAGLRAVQAVRSDAFNTLHTFQVIQHEHQAALARRADLLATLAMLRDGDASTVKETGEDPWQSGDCDLMVLADARGQIVALHSTIPAFPQAAAQDSLRRSLSKKETAGWWYSGTRLYQVVLQPFYDGDDQRHPSGTVVVGRGAESIVSDLGPSLSNQVVFRHDQKFVVSSLSPSAEQSLARQLDKKPFTEKIKLDDEVFLAASDTLSPDGSISITVLKSYTESARYLINLNRVLCGLGLLAVIGGGLLGFAVSDRFTRPLGSLVEGVRAFERGDSSFPLTPSGTDEVGVVTEAFDRMRRTLDKNAQQKQELENQLRQAQKMEALGRLAGGVAHDFNNVLTVIKGHSDILMDRLSASDSLRKNAAQIEKGASRAASLTRQLLAFCRMQVLQPKVLDLNNLITDACSLLKKLVREDIGFTFQAGSPLSAVRADPNQIEQILMNLTVNACDAMPRGGQLRIATRNVTVDEKFTGTRSPMVPGKYVLMSVSDTGHGMDADTTARIFEPFFTTKEQGKGTGLGLATVYGIVKQSGGWIWVESEPGKGSRFDVYLPAVNSAADSQSVETGPEAKSENAEVVLIVEDEDGVRDLAAEFVSSAGYRVLTARDGKEALEVAGNSKARIDVLLTDVVMPNMRGPEVAKRLEDRLPELQVIYMSGYVEHNPRNEELGDAFFLQKPFSRRSLVEKVHEALCSARLSATPST